MTPRPAPSTPSPASHLRHLVLAMAGVVLVAVGVVAFAIVMSARKVDRHEVAETTHLAEVATRLIMTDLRSGTQDYTWWDEPVRRVVLDLDREWTGHLWGYYQENFRDNDLIISLSPDDQVIHVWEDSHVRYGGALPALEPDLDLMIRQARERPLADPAPVMAWMMLDGEVYAVGVAPITPSTLTWAREIGLEDRGVGIFARRLDTGLRQELADDYLLEGLRIVRPDEIGESPHLLLPGPTGEPVAAMVWWPSDDGATLALHLFLPIMLALLAMAPFLVMFARRATQLVGDDASLRESLRRERELGQLKSRFVSMISHEFRTPLTAIMASTEMLRHYSDRLDEEQRQTEFESIESEVERLTRLIDEVITLGHADAGGFQYEPESVNLAEMLRSLCDRALLANHSSNDIHLHGTDALDEVMADRRLVEYAIGNVLGNAVKYSPGGEAVDVVVSHDDRVITIEVTDQGIGIPEADLAEIGRPFYRATNSGRIGGTGLGLAIARRAAEEHGGGLEVTSEPGRGTKVAVTLRLGNWNQDAR